MRRIDELDEHEVIALTEEDIQRLVDLECANEGVPLIGPMPVPPNPISKEKDVPAWKVDGTLLADEDEAHALATYLRSLKRVTTRYLRGGYTYSGPQGIEPDESEIEVKKKMFWSSEGYTANRTKLDAFDEAKERYDKEKESWGKIDERRKICNSHVWSIYSAACEKHARGERIRETFEEYKVLADGDSTKALAFMVEAARYAEDEIREAVGMEAVSDET